MRGAVRSRKNPAAETIDESRRPVRYLRLLVIAALLILIPAGLMHWIRITVRNYESIEQYRHLEALETNVRQFYEESGGDTDAFTKRVSYYIAGKSQLGMLMILDEHFGFIVPDNEQFREARRELAADFADGIRQGTLKSGTEHKASSGNTYYVKCSTLQRSTGEWYLITYAGKHSKDSYYTGLIRQIRLIILLYGAVILLVLCFFFQRNSRAVRNFGAEIQRIGDGIYAPVVASYPFWGLDRLKRSLNSALEQLRSRKSRNDTLLHSVNHYLRNHLLASSGYALGIETGVFPPDEAVVKIRRENEAMEELLLNLSAQAYMAEQAGPENDTVLSVKDEIEECLDAFRKKAALKDIELILKNDDPACTVRGNKKLFETVMGNLISNAVRYAEKKVAVAVSGSGTEEQDSKIVIKVEDDGPGISSKDMPHIFEMMYKGRGGNIGLGLAVAREAAGHIKGTLTAENSPEGGAVFTLTLPS